MAINIHNTLICDCCGRPTKKLFPQDVGDSAHTIEQWCKFCITPLKPVYTEQEKASWVEMAKIAERIKGEHI